MKRKAGADHSTSKVISFSNYKNRKLRRVTSTIAAIIAIKIDHP